MMWLLIALAADPLGFHPGTAPLDLHSGEEEAVWSSSEGCADCHPAEAAQWNDSAHRVAWTNDLFQAGFLAETQPFCVFCHAPAQVQAKEVLANLDVYRALSPYAHPDTPVPPMMPEPYAAEGIGCAVCHLRDATVLTAKPVDPDHEAPHELRHAPELATEAGCQTCHEFAMGRFDNGALHLTDEPMQSTITEWREWKAVTGQDKVCQDCHMKTAQDTPTHAMTGARDPDRLRRSVSVTAVESPQPALVLEVDGAGHAVPTGDLFRHITVEVSGPDDAEFVVVDTLGRTFDTTLDGGSVHKHESADTRLWPGRPRSVPIPCTALGGTWRLRMHLGGPHDEARGLVPLDALIITFAEGPLPAVGATAQTDPCRI